MENMEEMLESMNGMEDACAKTIKHMEEIDRAVHSTRQMLKKSLKSVEQTRGSTR